MMISASHKSASPRLSALNTDLTILLDFKMVKSISYYFSPFYAMNIINPACNVPLLLPLNESSENTIISIVLCLVNRIYDLV